jgi:hypothetical protein
MSAGIPPRVSATHTLKTCAAQDSRTLQTHLRKTHRPPSSTARTLLGTSRTLAGCSAIFPKDRRSSLCCNAWPAAIMKNLEPNMNHLATILAEILTVLLIFATGFLLLAL